MRTRVPLLVGAILLAGLAMAGAATATQTDGQYHSLDESINGTDDGNETGVGICVVGADSPCNGEQWDGDNETSDDERQVSDDEQSEDGSDAGICMVGAGGPCNGEESATNRTADEKSSADEGDAGICMVGAGGPCNGEESATNRTADEKSSADEGDAGICMVGAGGPCNGEETDGDNLTPADQNRTGDRIEPEKDEGDEAGICLVGADSACNGDDASNGSAQITLETTGQQGQSFVESLFATFVALF